MSELELADHLDRNRSRTTRLNGAPVGRIDLARELDTAVSLVVADSRSPVKSRVRFRSGR